MTRYADTHLSYPGHIAMSNRSPASKPRGLQPEPDAVRHEQKFRVFRVRENAPSITPDLVAVALDE